MKSFTVFAHTDDGDHFLMFITRSEKFAHDNAKKTARHYVQNVVAYEFGGMIYQLPTQAR